MGNGGIHKKSFSTFSKRSANLPILNDYLSLDWRWLRILAGSREFKVRRCSVLFLSQTWRGNVNETTKKVRCYGCMEIACQINLNIWKAGSKHPPERNLLLILKWNYRVCYFTTALRKSNCPFPINVTSESEGGCYTWKAITSCT